MNYLENERNKSRHNIDSSNQKRHYSNIPINNNSNINLNNPRGKSYEIKKGISLTPDRRNFTQNSNYIRNNNNNINYTITNPKTNNNTYSNNNNNNNNNNNHYQKYNFNQKIHERNFSIKKTEENNSKIYDNGNILENINHNDNSKISQNNEYSYNVISDYSSNSRFSNISSAQSYLDRRHMEAKQKINKLRHDKFTQESSELKFKPKISDNSKKIIQNLVHKEKAVKINPNLLNREKYKNYENDVRISENNNNSISNKNENGYNPSMKNYLNNKYSQFDDYKKIVERRELMQNNNNNNFNPHPHSHSQKSTIEVKNLNN
jgi:hypothetical protein